VARRICPLVKGAISRKAMTSGVDKRTYEGGKVFSGSSGPAAGCECEYVVVVVVVVVVFVVVVEVGGRESSLADGAVGGKAAAMAQKGHDGSAPRRRGREGGILGQRDERDIHSASHRSEYIQCWFGNQVLQQVYGCCSGPICNRRCNEDCKE
jgi:hypothetical protein